MIKVVWFDSRINFTVFRSSSVKVSILVFESLFLTWNQDVD